MADNPALLHAAKAGPVVGVYVLDEKAAGDHAYGGASRVWLHHALDSLSKSLAARSSKIILRRGDAVEELCSLAEEVGAETIHANRHYEPWWRKAQGKLAKRLDLQLYDANFLFPPGHITTGSGDPYKIYTPFSKATLEQFPPRDVIPEPDTIRWHDCWPASDALSDWGLLPTSPDRARGIRDFWEIGEAAAHDRLDWWASEVAAYDEGRNLPGRDLTSQLSPYLHWGEISPVQVYHRLKENDSQGWQTYLKELIWRDYAQNIICQFPAYPRESYRNYDERVLWRDPSSDPQAAADLEAWQRGQTGYPIVDAGMRQLWQTGWMHNRVRMIAASFLVKHLLLDWQYGESWFWDCLVDADYANNGVNWQWVSGTGVDSNMFSRIMAPLSQSEKFGAADYIRTYVPELGTHSDAEIHDPPDENRGRYPTKIIGHREARERALAAYARAKR